MACRRAASLHCLERARRLVALSLAAAVGAGALACRPALEPQRPARAETRGADASAAEPEALPPTDSDGDGVLDSDDQCPTVAEDRDGFEDGDGCPDKAVIWERPKVTTDPVDFDEGSSTSGGDAATFLDKLAAAIIANPGVGTVTVVGHADRRERHASRLAARRAEAVRDGLAARGVPPERLRTQAVVRDPIACARGVDCARIRRRVEFQFGGD